MRLGEGKMMSDGEGVKKSERETEKERRPAEWRLGVSRVSRQLTERPGQRGGGKGRRRLHRRSRGREWPMRLHLDIEATI